MQIRSVLVATALGLFVNAVVVGCGSDDPPKGNAATGGSSGTGGGSATGGSSGTGGTWGTGGTSTGGSSGTGGAATGGTGATAGSSGEAGASGAAGTAGQAGASGSAGAAGEGGAAGSAGSAGSAGASGAGGMAGWTCSPAYFDDGTKCHCACGTWDPDCDVPGAEIGNCQYGQSCVQPGVCVGVPSEWTCDDAAFSDGAVCHCGCGAYDEDCDHDQLPIEGCNAGEVCGSNGSCVAEGWSCPPSFYGAGDGCDCACGAWDADCEDPAQGVFGCGKPETLPLCIDEGKCD